MLKRVGALLVGVSVLAGLAGCVSLDTYQMKEQEVQSLTGVNEDMRKRIKSLRDEKTGLEARVGEMKKGTEELEYRIEKQDKQIGFLKNWAESIENDRNSMRDRMEQLNAKIAELDKENQRLATLTLPENLVHSLGDRVAGLQKQVEALSGENEKLKNREVVFSPEEKKSSGTEGERTMESAAGNPQAVAVSSGQKAADSESHKQQNMRERAHQEDRVPFVFP